MPPNCATAESTRPRGRRLSFDACSATLPRAERAEGESVDRDQHALIARVLKGRSVVPTERTLF